MYPLKNPTLHLIIYSYLTDVTKPRIISCEVPNNVGTDKSFSYATVSLAAPKVQDNSGSQPQIQLEIKLPGEAH